MKVTALEKGANIMSDAIIGVFGGLIILGIAVKTLIVPPNKTFYGAEVSEKGKIGAKIFAVLAGIIALAAVILFFPMLLS